MAVTAAPSALFPLAAGYADQFLPWPRVAGVVAGGVGAGAGVLSATGENGSEVKISFEGGKPQGSSAPAQLQGRQGRIGAERKERKSYATGRQFRKAGRESNGAE